MNSFQRFMRRVNEDFKARRNLDVYVVSAVAAILVILTALPIDVPDKVITRGHAGGLEPARAQFVLERAEDLPLTTISMIVRRFRPALRAYQGRAQIVDLRAVCRQYPEQRSTARPSAAKFSPSLAARFGSSSRTRITLKASKF